MALIRWSPSPVRDLVSMQEEMNRIFDGVFNRTQLSQGLPFTPVVDIDETPEEFLVRVDLPGIAQKDVKVSLMGDTLTIRGERKQENKDAGNPLRAERVYGAFERSIALGAPVRGDQVRATYKDGVLEIHVPKAEEARQREIQVQVG